MITYDFTGKVCLVTGSSRGIGAAILSAFARAGATAVLHYWDDPAGVNKADAEALLPNLGSRALALAADVRDAGQMQQLMATVRDRFGGLDVLVNNAGILKDRTIRKMTPEDWDGVIDTNLTGVFHSCKFGGEILHDGGRIVNIAAGVIGMTRSLAKEFARRKITVNAIAPGIVETSMMADIKEEMRAEYVKQIPIGRFAQPAEIAHAVLFLACEESGYITGQVLPVTGGWV
jgi:3-oxoacyl-[acyl-carrier protein] reductase